MTAVYTQRSSRGSTWPRSRVLHALRRCAYPGRLACPTGQSHATDAPCYALAQPGVVGLGERLHPTPCDRESAYGDLGATSVRSSSIANSLARSRPEGIGFPVSAVAAGRLRRRRPRGDRASASLPSAQLPRCSAMLVSLEAHSLRDGSRCFSGLRSPSRPKSGPLPQNECSPIVLLI